MPHRVAGWIASLLASADTRRCASTGGVSVEGWDDHFGTSDLHGIVKGFASGSPVCWCICTSTTLESPHAAFTPSGERAHGRQQGRPDVSASPAGVAVDGRLGSWAPRWAPVARARRTTNITT